MRRFMALMRPLSYAFDVPLATRRSLGGFEIQAVLRRGQPLLLSPNATYSYGNRYGVFVDAFAQLPDAVESVKQVLVLGYGLGSIPTILRDYHGFHGEVTGVEYDPAIRSLANKIGYINRTTLLEQTAENFVRTSQTSYDLICIDVFVDDEIPVALLTEEFISGTRRLLRPGGRLFFNHLGNSADRRSHAEAYFSKVFEPAFEESLLIRAKHNHVLFGQA